MKDGVAGCTAVGSSEDHQRGFPQFPRSPISCLSGTLLSVDVCRAHAAESTLHAGAEPLTPHEQGTRCHVLIKVQSRLPNVNLPFCQPTAESYGFGLCPDRLVRGALRQLSGGGGGVLEGSRGLRGCWRSHRAYRFLGKLVLPKRLGNPSSPSTPGRLGKLRWTCSPSSAWSSVS